MSEHPLTQYQRGCDDQFAWLGEGALGGKAGGLARMRSILEQRFPEHRFGPFVVDIPQMTVLRTGLYEAFCERNNLAGIDWSAQSDDEIALAFQRGTLPTTVLGDLTSLVQRLHRPIAVRSSSMLEDAAGKPFAGVYATKMIPNNQVDAETRFHRLVEAVKFVYASLSQRSSREYARAVGLGQDSMAVILQEVVGERHGELWYPHISGVARSYNFYPTGNARPEHGVVNLALGLGKTIVDGGRSWTYSPAYPQSPPPYSGPRDILMNTQTEFWAVNMGRAPHDPIRETEYMLRRSITQAERDGVLPHLCSTYDGQSDRFYTGLFGNGPRLLDFAPLLKANMLPLNELIRQLLEICEEEYGAKVELEFAVTLGEQPRLGFLQVRPMIVSGEFVEADPAACPPDSLLLASRRAMGNGSWDSLQDVVYVKPQAFDAARTREVGAAVAQMNETLTGVPYVLIGFGRWGTSDPWLGIPVLWSQIAGARVLVEATLPTMHPDLSQGSHFFHNVSSQGIPCFAVRDGLDWPWLESLPALHENDWVRHVRTPAPLRIRVDGRAGHGYIAKGGEL